jgi:hypothetical protein
MVSQVTAFQVSLSQTKEHCTAIFGMEGYQHIPVEDLILKQKLQIAKLKNYETFNLQCCNCKVGLRKSIPTIRQHLHFFLQDQFLYYSMLQSDPIDNF